MSSLSRRRMLQDWFAETHPHPHTRHTTRFTAHARTPHTNTARDTRRRKGLCLTSGCPVDRMGLDFAFIAAQTSLFDTPDRPYSVPLPSTLLQDITQLLAHEAGVEQWSEWLV